MTEREELRNRYLAVIAKLNRWVPEDERKRLLEEKRRLLYQLAGQVIESLQPTSAP